VGCVLRRRPGKGGIFPHNLGGPSRIQLTCQEFKEFGGMHGVGKKRSLICQAMQDGGIVEKEGKKGEKGSSKEPSPSVIRPANEKNAIKTWDQQQQEGGVQLDWKKKISKCGGLGSAALKNWSGPRGWERKKCDKGHSPHGEELAGNGLDRKKREMRKL